MNTPADKPDLPEPPGLNQAALAWENTMREVGWPPSIDECMAFKDGYIVATNEGRQLLALQEATHKAALANERRKALEEAEEFIRQRLDAAKRTHEASAGLYSEGQRDAYSVAVLDIQSLIDRKEPT